MFPLFICIPFAFFLTTASDPPALPDGFASYPKEQGTYFYMPCSQGSVYLCLNLMILGSHFPYFIASTKSSHTPVFSHHQTSKWKSGQNPRYKIPP